MLLSQFPLNAKWDAPFHRLAYDYSCADCDGFRDHLRDVPWDNLFKLRASSAASEFCEWVQVRIDVYILIVSIRLSLIHPHGFFCTNKINLLSLKQSSDRLVIAVKGFLKLPNLHMLLRQKNPSLPRNLLLRTFGELLIVF